MGNNIGTIYSFFVPALVCGTSVHCTKRFRLKAKKELLVEYVSDFGDAFLTRVLIL